MKGKASEGLVPPGALLTAEEAKRRLGIGDWAWRKMRRDGLRVLRVSGRAFVLTDDLIEFLRTRGQIS
jgi:hypothetical protein